MFIICWYLWVNNIIFNFIFIYFLYIIFMVIIIKFIWRLITFILIIRYILIHRFNSSRNIRVIILFITILFFIIDMLSFLFELF